MTASEDLFARATAVVPGGVNSPVRAFRAVGGTPRFIDRAHGPYVVDVDGNDYVDLVCSWGPMILGHAHPAVVEALQVAATKGTSYGMPSPGEVELAEAIIARVPAAQAIRLVNSGTEATMSAIRLARGFTGRSSVVKFAGCYHGHVDALLAAAGSGPRDLRQPRYRGGHRRRDRLHDRAALQRRRRARGGFRSARRGHRVRDHRGGRREHGRRATRAGLQPGAEGDHRQARGRC